MIITKTSGQVPDALLKAAQSTQSFFRVAAIQMASGPNVKGNLEEADRLVNMAASTGARIIVLPEYFAIMGLKETDKVLAAEAPGEGPIQQWLSETAARHRVYLIGGSVPMKSSVPGKVRNACLVYDKEGKLAARYDKIHLFNLALGSENFSEERTIEPGDEVVTLQTPYGRIGLSICYDLRFPELYRAMGEMDIIVVPSAFTATTGKAHWEPLIRARAIENLAYVIAPAQGGFHVNGRETHGDTMIVDPWGVVLDRLPRGSGVVVAGINPTYQQTVRKSLPALTHRTLKQI
ncbi:MAG TPA: carbon-nitrogen hydrolase family protein [Usitatibacteraceae bacterium]|nr:carbon-nitrogen hydrolase family protein [Usitatibacteraceae bacterium]